jgi:hypothetical protein
MSFDEQPDGCENCATLTGALAKAESDLAESKRNEVRLGKMLEAQIAALEKAREALGACLRQYVKESDYKNGWRSGMSDERYSELTAIYNALPPSPEAPATDPELAEAWRKMATAAPATETTCGELGCVDGKRLDYNPRTGQGKEYPCNKCAPAAQDAGEEK